MRSRHIFIMVITLSLVSACSLKKNCSELVDDPTAYRQCQASNGDKQAQYEIGRDAFQTNDTNLAIKWLERAAQPVSGQETYSKPAMPGESYGTAFVYDTGPISSGHNEAQKLLAKIYEEGLGTDVNLKKAEKYKRMSKKQYNFN